MEKNKNGFLPWFILILVTGLILGGMAGYYYFSLKEVSDNLDNSAKSISKKQDNNLDTQKDTKEVSSDENAGWQTYNNEKYGYTLRYPQGWGLIDYAYDSINDSVENKWEFVLIDKNTIADNSVPFASETPTTLFQMSAIAQTEQIDNKNVIKSTININGVTADKYVYTTQSEFDGNYYTIIQFEKDSQAYNISLLNTDAEGTHPEEVDKIIESITF